MGRTTRTIVLVLGATALSFSSACSSTLKSARPRGEAQPGALPNVPAILRGTIGTEATLRGMEPTLVSGYGVVVGLTGTGSADIPLPVRAMLEREMSLKGVGQESMGMGDISPTRMLNDPNTAVVLVQAVVPPGAPINSRFDVLITALPGTSTTSLEGGSLWTTDLTVGFAVPGGPATRRISEARGDLFINPFTDPAASTDGAVNRTVGRVLNGGRVVEPRSLLLALNTPSHVRARAIAGIINSRFPRGAGDRLETARGVNEEHVEINIPTRYRDDTGTFLQLLLNTRIDPSLPQDWSARYARALRDRPELATPLMWRLRALGETSIASLRDLYDYPETTPRLAALEAGARLGDALAAGPLIDIATKGEPALRTRAITLLGHIGPAPTVNLAPRKMLDDDEMDIRIAAYEALEARGDISISRLGVEGKFRLDVVPAQGTLVYVTQQNEPRIVLFGADAMLERPLFVSGWSDRLMLTADAGDEAARIYYRDYATGRSTTSSVSLSLAKLLQFMAHTETPESPEPGLAMTYSEVVGAMHEIWRDGGYDGDFVAEQDRLAADLLRARQGVSTPDRPEGDEEAQTPDIPGFTPPRPIGGAPRPDGGKERR